MFDELKEECGVFGLHNVEDAAALTTLGLHALQHRGQEAAGIITVNNKKFNIHHGAGKVGDIFNDNKIIDYLEGKSAIGHVRYSTAGNKNFFNCQPLHAELELGNIAIAHNGNLTNAQILKKSLINSGSIFNSTMDTEVILHLVAKSKLKSFSDRLIDALKKVKGAYSIVALADNKLFAVRDPNGVRPLALGKLNNSYVVASESCAFDIMGAKFVRDIEAGEFLIIENDKIQSFKPFATVPAKFCIFEYIYFSRPDSFIGNKYVYQIRQKIGEILADESSVDADVVVAVPDSGIPAAMGYAKRAGIPFEFGIIRNHYVGRTFIEPTDAVRHLGVKLKHNANVSVIKGKKIILVDDTIVRGTTSKKIVEMLRNAGAKEIHMRISAPPTTDPCFYGVDTPDKSKLLASHKSVKEIEKLIGADSLKYISLDGLYQAIIGQNRNNKEAQFCDACFSGDYGY